MGSDAVHADDSEHGARWTFAVWPCAASRIRAAILFVILDAVTVVIGYGLAEVTYFRDRAPSGYWMHFTEFLAVAVVVTILSNRFFGLYGRMWRHAGAEEARQLLLSVATTLSVLIAFWPVGRYHAHRAGPAVVVVVGCMFAAGGMGILRFHSRLFAWQRGSKRLGLRVAVIGSRDAGAAAIREMLRSPGAGLIPVAVFDDDAAAHGLSLLGVPWSAASTTSRGGEPLHDPAGAAGHPLPAARAGRPRPAGLRGGRGVHEDPPRREGHGRRARTTSPPCARPASRRSRTSSAGPRSPPTSRRCAGRSTVAGSWSPGPVAPSARRSAARWRARPGRARPPRPRRDPPPRHRRHPRRTGRAGPGRHLRPRGRVRGLRALPPRGRVPRRRPQARPGARGPPARGGQDQRLRHPQRGRGRRRRSAPGASS